MTRMTPNDLFDRELASEWLLRVAPQVRRLFDEMVKESTRDSGAANNRPETDK